MRDRGRQMSDIEAGAAAGLGLRIPVAARPCQTGGGDSPPHEVVADLSEALALLRSRFARGSVPISASGRSPIRHLNLPLRSAITIAESARLRALDQLASRAGRLGSQVEVG